jgi:hypothetical protein
MKKISEKKKVFTLHRYFIWANTMKLQFYRILEQTNNRDITNIELLMYMSLWYGLLYVVIEGWQGLNLSDINIDKLLNSPNIALLKKYRNGCFHFQEEYWNEKFKDLINNGLDCAKWITNVHDAIGDYLLNYIQSIKIRMHK